MPRIFDRARGVSDFSVFPGFHWAQNVPEASQVYSAFLVGTFLIFAVFGRLGPAPTIRDAGGLSVPLQYFCMLLSISPLITVMFAPEPFAYLKYASVAIGTSSREILAYHEIVSAFALLAILCSSALIAGGDNVRAWVRLFGIVALLGSVWVTGKRAAVAIAIVALLIVAVQRSRVPRRNLVLGGCLATFFLGAYSVFYQATFRAESELANGVLGYRIDYTRDSPLLMAISSELRPGILTILEFRGQSYLYNVLSLVPRDFLSNKPYPYSYYFTSALFELPPQDLGWGMTTSIFDEAVANLGLSGLLLAPLAVGLLAILTDRVTSSFTRALCILIICGLCAIQVSVLLPLIVFVMSLLLVSLSMRLGLFGLRSEQVTRSV
ncbi:hypothetical protein [Rhodococcus sp. IEGM 1408]|uniref:hypothetical protein n=1 Tax=Rhodococcus sp. IEGM 1408 TaxID=3082220 RepID=UPI0029559E46|nr:hypothetical protein [Rhodococcus sp. IEGM 1408]MDV8001439.1 hypothetical protein [Rhodococcus sp. IEGM 1408]